MLSWKNLMTKRKMNVTIKTKHYISVDMLSHFTFIDKYHFIEGRPLRIFQ